MRIAPIKQYNNSFNGFQRISLSEKAKSKFLPLATATMLGIGALSSCTNTSTTIHSNDAIQDMHNSLDSLERLRVNKEVGFVDFYNKSIAIINSINLKEANLHKKIRLNNLEILKKDYLMQKEVKGFIDNQDSSIVVSGTPKEVKSRVSIDDCALPFELIRYDDFSK